MTLRVIIRMFLGVRFPPATLHRIHALIEEHAQVSALLEREREREREREIYHARRHHSCMARQLNQKKQKKKKKKKKEEGEEEGGERLLSCLACRYL
jgi:hypothetical protein